MFYSLLRCPICRAAPSGPDGCCKRCASTLFAPEVAEMTLSLGVYEGSLEGAIRAYKFHGVRRLSGLFGKGIAEAIGGFTEAPEIVCAVPLHPLRFMQRGYNQSALVGRIAARHANLPYRPLLRRVRSTRQQARLGADARQTNIAGAFRAQSLRGERVLLIDDVTTSGATLTECALELFRAGAGHVYTATLARAL